MISTLLPKELRIRVAVTVAIEPILSQRLDELLDGAFTNQSEDSGRPASSLLRKIVRKVGSFWGSVRLNHDGRHWGRAPVWRLRDIRSTQDGPFHKRLHAAFGLIDFETRAAALTCSASLKTGVPDVACELMFTIAGHDFVLKSWNPRVTVEEGPETTVLLQRQEVLWELTPDLFSRAWRSALQTPIARRWRACQGGDRGIRGSVHVHQV